MTKNSAGILDVLRGMDGPAPIPQRVPPPSGTEPGGF